MVPQILIVESDPEVRNTLGVAIKSLNYAVVKCPSSQLAKQILTYNRDFALIVLNNSLPDGTGKELILTMRDALQIDSLPIICMSESKLGINDVDELLTLGASYFFPMPINVESLKIYISKILAKYRVDGAG